jgi:hypothetical protein
MYNLFGNECSVLTFRHDKEMRMLHPDNQSSDDSQQTQATDRSKALQMLPLSSPVQRTPQRPLPLSDCGGNGIFSNARGSHVASTPPHETIASSPGSESQNLRRKVILGGIGEDRAKRPRFRYEGHSSPTPENSQDGTDIRARSTGILFQANHTELEVDLDALHESGSNAEFTRGPQSPIFAYCVNETVSDRTSHERSYKLLSEVTFWDPKDKIRRCIHCGHEWWRPVWGFCTHCEDGQYGHPYFELLDDGAIPEFGFEPNNGGYYDDDEDYKWDTDDIEGIIGVDDYLDVQSSAYDSQDEDSEFHEEYEVNTFINDDSETSDNENDTPSDEETNYKQEFVELQKLHADKIKSYDKLLTAFISLDKEFTNFRQDVMELDYESDNGSKYNEEGLLIVPDIAPEPVLTEVILSATHSQSEESAIITNRVSEDNNGQEITAAVALQAEPQELELSSERVRNRANAYEAAIGTYNPA